MRLVIAMVMMLLLSACDGGRDEIQKKMNESKIVCPPNASERITGWGQVGLSRFCMTYNGRWQGWDNGALRVDGYYVDNKKDGEWVWYAKDGTVEKTVIYKQGVEILPKN